MYVEHLSLSDFRCYRSAEVALSAGVTVFVGSNGQGKTNLVEAVEYLSTLSSHRVSSDAPLVRAGAEQAIARARVRAGRDDTRSLLLELEINPGRANRARINKSPQQRPREMLGVLRTVLFSPEDLTIVKGEPSDRRRFIDQVVTTRWPRMAGVRADYDRVLRQRNSLLKQLAQRGGQRAMDEAAAVTLDVFDDQLADLGAELLLARLDTLTDLMPHTREAYAGIAPTNNLVSAAYRTSIDLSPPVGANEDPSSPSDAPLPDVPGPSADPDASPAPAAPSGPQPADDPAAADDPAPVDDAAPADGPAPMDDPALADEPAPSQVIPPTGPTREDLAGRLRAELVARRRDELARGVTLAGPHRDEIVLSIGDLPAKGYASHGECWSLSLALKLGAFHLVRADGIDPVLILDDVFAELDATRRQRLAHAIGVAEQVLITAAVADDVPADLGGRHFRVQGGEVHDPGDLSTGSVDNVGGAVDAGPGPARHESSEPTAAAPIPVDEARP